MDKADVKKLADEAGIDITNHILSLPLERQKVLCQMLGYGDDFERYVKQTLQDSVDAKKHLEIMDKNPPYQFPSKEREAEFHRRYDSEERGVKVLKIEDMKRWMVDDPLP